MPHQQDPGELEQRAAEELLGDASLRDELTDNEAQPLIDWGLAQVAALARQAAAQPPGAEPVDMALQNLHRLMKRINRFVGLRTYGDPEALAVELDRLRVVSGKLYGARPALLPDEAARYALVDEIEGMGNEQVVQRLLALFGPQEAPAASGEDAVTPDDVTAYTDMPSVRLIAPPARAQHSAPPVYEQSDAPPGPTPDEGHDPSP